MTYIDYLNQLNLWLESNAMASSSQLMYYKLLHVFNRAGWPSTVQVDNRRMQMMLDGLSLPAIVRARDKLVAAGFIRYHKGKKGSPNRYELTKGPKIQLTNVTESVTDSVTESVTESVTHIKTKTKNKKKKDTPPNPLNGEGASGFDDFWKAYPRKVAKQEARKAWYRLSPGEALVTEILSAVDRSKRSDQWQRDNGSFIPYPATWINGRRWEDENGPQKVRSYDIEELDKMSFFDVPDWEEKL